MKLRDSESGLNGVGIKKFERSILEDLGEI